MQALIQRVSEARVLVDHIATGSIGKGLLILLCAEHGDTVAEVDRLIDKILKLRIFSDERGKMNRSVQDVGGGLLIVSQFTLAADTSGGNRPSFTAAAEPEMARRLYEAFIERVRVRHADVQTGAFGAMMAVHLVNDGPVTIPIRIPASQAGA